MDERALSESLQRFLRRVTGEQVHVERFSTLAGGASRETFAFDLRRDGETRARELVLRLDPDAGRMQSDRREEFVLLQLAGEHGVTVPRVHWLGEEDDGLDARFIVMDRVRGEAIARRLLRDALYERTRAALPAALARELARIHSIDAAEPRLETLRSRAPAGDDPRRFALAEIDRYRTLLAAVDGDWPRPVLRFAARRLVQHAPRASRAALVHGDFRIGNVMFDEQGLTAVLDWELAHIGDPMEDLGWLAVRAWRFGNDDRPVGGLCAREELWEAYGRERGESVDQAAALWWEAFGDWKWAVICVLQAAGHKAGRYPNVELASLGRRVAEVEAEVLARIRDIDASRASSKASVE